MYYHTNSVAKKIKIKFKLYSKLCKFKLDKSRSLISASMVVHRAEITRQAGI